MQLGTSLKSNYCFRELTAEWMEEYNQRRPHERINNMTPFEWKDLLLKRKIQQEYSKIKRKDQTNKC